MKKMDWFALTIAIVILLVAYLTSLNLIIAIATGIIYVAYYFLVAKKMLVNCLNNNKKAHECYNFINTFVITLSVKESLDEAYESATRNADGLFLEFLHGIKDMDSIGKLNYLTKYFHYSSYRMFTKVIALYQEQGGNILKMSESLLSENNRIEQASLDNENESKRKAVEFSILWFLGFLVLVFMRFALNNFYESMLKSIVFMILLVVFFLLVLLSIHIFIIRYSKTIAKQENVSYE